MLKFVKVATLSEISPGEKMRVTYQVEGGCRSDKRGRRDLRHIGYLSPRWRAFDGRESDGFEIECPRHGARFNVKTGEETPPAFEPVPLHYARIEGGPYPHRSERGVNGVEEEEGDQGIEIFARVFVSVLCQTYSPVIEH